MSSDNNAAQALSSFDISEATQSADEMAAAFEVASNRIANALQSAARTGEFSFSQMAESIARDLARIAVQELIAEPIQGLFNSASSSLISQGISPKSTPVNVTMNVSGIASVADFKKSETQLAAGLSRAISQGRKLT